MSKKTVLVTGCGGSAASNFIHSLKIAPEMIEVVGIDTSKYHLELSAADYKYLVPQNNKVEDFILILNKIIKKHKVDLIHPQPDPQVLFFAEYKNLINSKFFLPSLETVQACQDKLKTVEILEKNNIPVAKSHLIKNRKSLKSTFGKLSKNNEKLWLRAIRGAGSKAALPINDLNHAHHWIDYWQKNKNTGYGDFMLSEFLPGDEFAFQSVWNNGKLIVSQARKRMEYVFGNLMPSGQSSSPSIAVTVNRKDVNKVATKAILAIDPKATGVFCVDLKENSMGIPCVMEINAGRFFTTSNFFSVAGCNMPYLYLKLALGEVIPTVKKYNNLKSGLYWLRMIDMGYKLVDKNWSVNEEFGS